MLKTNIKLGALCVFAFSLVIVLSGCKDRVESQEQKQNQTQVSQPDQSQEIQEQKEEGENLKNYPRNGNPPAQMIEVCSGKSEGDNCEVSMRRKNSEEIENKRAGICKKMGEDESLSCVPENMPQGGPNREMLPNTKEE
ncbi:MAG: hypothetical protein UR60_C0034G0003 [Candidatus Moranbacteria bacterium GW2011_GWF2_34_56]|nr:MAG: hypothetical protein UR51_C0014G0015 [Candidatus Moranbacteria bacterium GW2011_GWF1_34_10]KKP63933.1 MAG: hypothetical protein UR60_C0034G0003 [Candidatus Moranbacteria bacterium GW2011_GWF2_34_56]HBI17047.1 hypothetical protein [Candidatus Moranbacteria bacterium]